MVLPLLLMLLLSIFVFYCIIYMIKQKDDINALGFVFLYVYTIFAQIGYVCYPEISIFIGAYYGLSMFYYYWIFIFLSFACTFFMYKYFPFCCASLRYKIIPIKNKKYSLLFIVFTLFLYLAIYCYYLKNITLFSWGGANPMGSTWFVIFFRYFTVCMLIVYVLFRQTKSMLKLLLFLLYLYLFMQISSSSGSRSTILYFFFSIAFFELYPLVKTFNNNKSKIFKLLFLSIVLMLFLFAILELRNYTNDISISSIIDYATTNTDFKKTNPLYMKILFQDYYVPSHTLFLSMHYDFIDFIETLRSNIFNSLLGFKYPYLSESVVKLVDRDVERGVGWAYHLFVEGYNAFGWFGIFYNAIVWNIMLSLWKVFINTDNLFYKRFFLSLFAYNIVIVVRSQSCAFVQAIWMIYVPSMLFLLMATNSKMIISVKNMCLKK